MECGCLEDHCGLPRRSIAIRNPRRRLSTRSSEEKAWSGLSGRALCAGRLLARLPDPFGITGCPGHQPIPVAGRTEPSIAASLRLWRCGAAPEVPTFASSLVAGQAAGNEGFLDPGIAPPQKGGRSHSSHGFQKLSAMSAQVLSSECLRHPRLRPGGPRNQPPRFRDRYAQGARGIRC